MDFLPLVAKWIKGEWGYIRNKGVEFRKGDIQPITNHLYIGTFAGSQYYVCIITS
jgi:hypothetical protein